MHGTIENRHGQGVGCRAAQEACTVWTQGAAALLRWYWADASRSQAELNDTSKLLLHSIFLISYHSHCSGLVPVTFLTFSLPHHVQTKVLTSDVPALHSVRRAVCKHHGELQHHMSLTLLCHYGCFSSLASGHRICQFKKWGWLHRKRKRWSSR